MSDIDKVSVNYQFDNKLKKYKQKLIDFFLDIASHKRTNPKLALISVNLLLHGKLTQKQLKELTGFSIGSISTYLIVMMGIGAVEKELVPGTHKYTYSIVGNIEDLFSLGFHIFLRFVLGSEPFLNKLKEELMKLIMEKKKGAKQLLQRVEDIQDVFNIYKKSAPLFMKSKFNNVS